MFPFSHLSRPLVLTCGLSWLFAAPVLAQTSNSPTSTGNSAVAAQSSPTVAPKQKNMSVPPEEIPTWLKAVAVLGSVLGLAGTGLATYLYLEKQKLEQKLENLNSQITPLKNTPNIADQVLPQIPSTIANVICSSLGYKNQLSTNYRSDQSAEAAVKGALEGLIEDIRPKLNQTEKSVKKIHSDFDKLATYIESHNKQNDTQVSEANKRAAQLETNFQRLDETTRGELEAFIYNIYNLVFTQQEGDPVAPHLERCARYEKLVADLRAIQPDEMTTLPLRELEESLLKIDAKLQVARQWIAQRQSGEVEPLPYLDEAERARAGELLEVQRKKLRGQTAGIKESLDDLRDAVIGLSKPLQTLWLGASVHDTDQPERTERCHTLLVQIKAIFQAAGVEVYQACVGEEIDTGMVNYKFEGDAHEAPFIASKVTKLGLRVEDRTEPGAVVVA